MWKNSSFVGDFIGGKVEEAVANKAKGISGRVAGKLYGKAASKAADVISDKTIERFDEFMNSKNSVGTLDELLSRNPQNSKLILLPDFRIQDGNGKQRYRIENAMFSSRTWYLYGDKIRKIASVQENRRGFLKKLVNRKTSKKDYVIKVKGHRIGNLNTLLEEDGRIGKTDFNDWRVTDNQIFDGSQCVSSLQKAKSWKENKWVLDYSTEIDELVMLLILFSIRKADERDNI